MTEAGREIARDLARDESVMLIAPSVNGRILVESARLERGPGRAFGVVDLTDPTTETRLGLLRSMAATSRLRPLARRPPARLSGKISNEMVGGAR